MNTSEDPVQPVSEPAAERKSLWAQPIRRLMMPSPDDPSNLAPDQRPREIAPLLARGILRLQCILPAEPAIGFLSCLSHCSPP